MKRRAERNGERSRAKLNEANKRIRPGKLNSPGWIEVVQHTKAWDPEMYQEAYIFNQPRFLSRRAFHFYPILLLSIAKQYLHLQVRLSHHDLPHLPSSTE